MKSVEIETPQAVLPGVCEVIAERVKSGSEPNKRDDEFNVGCIIEGGGKRGVVSAGEGIALQALKAVDAIDSFHTASAGSCTGAYLLGNSEQGPEGAAIYYNYIYDRIFMDPLRPLRRRNRRGPIVDIPYLTDTVMREKVPLDWERVINSQRLSIYATSAEDAETRRLSFTTQDELLEALHLTCRIPVMAGMPAEGPNGLHYTDGGVPNGGIVFDQAVEAGCTHLLVLLSRPEGTTGKSRSPLVRIGARKLRRAGYEKLADAVMDNAEAYAGTLKKIKEAESNPASNPQVKAIAVPAGGVRISRMERDREKLLQGAIAGFNATMKAFEEYELPRDPKIHIRPLK